MGMFNKSAAKKMASDADEFIVSDGKVHALVFQVAGKAMYSTATQLEDKVTERSTERCRASRTKVVKSSMSRWPSAPTRATAT